MKARKKKVAKKKVAKKKAARAAKKPARRTTRPKKGKATPVGDIVRNAAQAIQSVAENIRP
jgi:hypothetical protein